MALSTIVSYLKEFKVPVKTTTSSTFDWIFKRSKLYRTLPTTISRPSTHHIPNNRTKISERYLTILPFKNRQKVYFQHNFTFLPIHEKANFNFQFDSWAFKNTMEQHLFTNSTVAFSSTKLALQILFKYQLQVIF